MPDTPEPVQQVTAPPAALPRIEIAFCTQCKWNLRAAYFAQELLSTFGNAIGEVALRPATGGVFTVHLTYIPSSQPEQDSQTSPHAASSQTQPCPASDQQQAATTVLLWDRAANKGFPETKQLKQRVRDCIAPRRDLGHSDVHGAKGVRAASAASADGHHAAGETVVGENQDQRAGDAALEQRTREADHVASGSAGTASQAECEDCR